LRPGQVVVLNNLPAHKHASSAALIDARGAPVLYRPPYSPDCNSFELGEAEFKAHLRRRAPRTQHDFDHAISDTIECLTPDDALAFIRHCGYHSPNTSGEPA
jgi:transposase